MSPIQYLERNLSKHIMAPIATNFESFFPRKP